MAIAIAMAIAVAMTRVATALVAMAMERGIAKAKAKGADYYVIDIGCIGTFKCELSQPFFTLVFSLQ